MAEVLVGLDDAAAGRGRLFLVAGEPGIGKSRLAEEVAATARERGARVAWGRCWEAGGAPAYWPWVQVVRACLRSQGSTALSEDLRAAAVDIARMLPEIRDLFPDLPAPTAADPESARFQLFDSTTSLLLELAHGAPLVLVLEDLHAADTPSLLLLQFLVGQMADSRLLVVGNYRDVELTPDHPLTLTLAQLSREPSTRLLHLQGLSEDEVARLVGARLDVVAVPAIISALYRGTKGNPLFVGEAVRLLAAEGRLRLLDPAIVRVTLPKEIRGVIGRRLAHLDDACRDALSLASVLGTEFTTEVLGRLCGSASAELLDLLDRAGEAALLVPASGALGRWRFSHGLVREALYAELSSAKRMRLHRQAAQVLQEIYGSHEEAHLAELAHHFFEAAPLGDTAVAVDYARRAGEQAAQSLAYEEAARLYRMAVGALELCEHQDDELQGQLLLALGDASARAGDLLAAREAFFRVATIARRTGAASQLARASLGYGGRFVWARAGDDPHLVAMLQDALVLLGGGDDRLRVRLLARLACALRSSPDRERSDTLSRQALETARGLDDPATLGFALEARFWAIYWPENPEERLDLATELIRVAEAANDAERTFAGRLARYMFLADLGAVADSRAEVEAGARKAEELRQPAQRWVIRTAETMFALLEGDFDRAEKLMALQVRPGQPPTLARDDLSVHQMHRYLLAWERGGLAELEQSTRATVDELAWYPLHRAVLAGLLLELGREDEARAVFDELAVEGFRALQRDSEWLLGVALASEACSGLRDAERAAVLYQQLVPFERRHALGNLEGSLGAVCRYLGLLAQTLGRLDQAEHHLRTAIALNERMGARPWVAHSRFDLARVLSQRDGPGDRELALLELRLAQDICRELGMPALEDKAAKLVGDRPADGAREPSGQGRRVFRKEGEYWTVVFGTDAFRLKDIKGLTYLAQLLGHPGREFHVLDLATVAHGVLPKGAPPTPPGEDDLHPHDLAGAGPALDERAKAAYRQRLLDLEDELDEAVAWSDSLRASKLQEERDFLAGELSAAMGLGGRDRKPGSPSERARVNITRAVRAAVARVREFSPALASHLDATVHTGTFCCYSPDPGATSSWHV
jgi:tetratricopeptide (TPR) repeat protein